MSHSSYTASERRGIIAIAIFALLIMGFGAGLTLCSDGIDAQQEIPEVIVFPQMVDSTSTKINSSSKSKSKNSHSTQKKRTSTKKSKTYRRRSPLDEPVSPKE